jgi:hypothetical protein
MSSLAEASQRRRQNLNPLATQLGPPPPQFQAPNSAVSLSSPFHQTPYTPASGVRQYNPQQWGGAQTGYSPETGRYSPSPADVVMGKLTSYELNAPWLMIWFSSGPPTLLAASKP